VGKFPPTSYFDSLFDDFGIWQHTDGTIILREEGYALDDATRGLLLTLALGHLKQSETLWLYILKSRSDDNFYGFAKSDRQFIPTTASEDAIGQVIWVAGYAYSRNFHKDEALRLITDIDSNFDNVRHMRGYAYALLGTIYINKKLAERYYKKLRTFFENTDEKWPWPEPSLTYGNGIMPYAFLRYGLTYSDQSSIEFGRKLLLFLEDHCTYGRQLGPIGNDGWLAKGTTVAPLYSQQPIDAAYMIWAWLAAYKISNDMSDKKHYEDWLQWFEGKNIAGSLMYNPENLKAFDGINQIGTEHSDKHGINYHSGAESNICFLLSRLMVNENIII
jgi:hypothetical protein